MGPSDGDNFELCPGREQYSMDDHGAAEWEEQMTPALALARI